MKILAIRGENLASLEGPFVVDLEAPPLASAGLFAITGPTGAGKSTLLDALCLALFDKTPRLSERGGAVVGRPGDEEGARLPAFDVRGLLRKGCGEGFAQVDFLGKGGRWRATWRVRRARQRPDGRFQATTLELQDLATGQLLAGGKTEILAAIEDKLGLTFDQFRRSVLLAQGDFAAFLKAGADERAQLLERMTGTALYGQISRVAHERAKETRAALAQLENEARGVSLLDAEARQVLELHQAEAAAARQAAQAEKEALQAGQRWYTDRDTLAAQVAEAQTHEADAEARWRDAAPAREALARAEAAGPLRATVEALDRATREAQEAAEAHTRAHVAFTSAEATLALADAAALAHKEALDAAVAARAAEAPALAEALDLDHQLATAGAESARRRAAAEARAADAQAASRAHHDALTREADLRAELDTVTLDLTRRQGDAPLAREWPRWKAELARYTDASAEARRMREGLDALVAGLPARIAAEAAARAHLEDSTRGLDAAEATLAAATSAAAAYDPQALSQERRHLEDIRGRLGQLMARAREVGTRSDRAEALRQELARAREARAAHQAAADAAEAGRAQVALQRDEAQHALDALQAAQDLTERRAALVPGEPCPLCGSADHPWAHGAPAVASLAEAQRARVRELDQRLQALAAEAPREAALATREGALATRAEAALAVEEGALEGLCRGWGDEVPDDPPGLPTVLTPAGASAALDAVGAALDGEARRRAALEAREQAGASLRQAEARAREAREAARQAALAAERRLRDAVHTREADEKEIATQTLGLENTRRRAEDAADTLAPAFAAEPSWREHLDGAPERFTADASARAAAFTGLEQRRDGLQRALDDQGPALAQASERARATALDAATTRADAEAHARVHQDLTVRRGRLLGGRPVAEAREALDARVKAAELAREASQTAQTSARADHAAAAARLTAAADQAEARLKARGAARQALDDALAGAAITEEDLRERLAWDTPRLQEARRLQDELQQALQAARTRLEERRARAVAHEATPHPAAPADALPEALAAATAAWTAADTSLAEILAQLHQDNQRRLQVASLLPRIEAQRRATAVWEDLDKLIGSADGKKLRTFAQGLTLDALLGQANQHLDDLARRYHVERIPGTDMDLQVVDRDMGDEVRTIHSLSGGEAFLVSLALALGLASLSSRQTRIDSLFIDEGFGSLDPATLEVALSTLDALQASGRKVGLISHVAGLAERIGVQVVVRPLGGGRSRVYPRGAAG